MALTASQIHALVCSNLKRHITAKHDGAIRDGRDGQVACNVCYAHVSVLRRTELQL